MIHTQHDVAENLVIRHLDMADGDTQAQNFLELELDGRANLRDLVAKIFGVGDRGGEFSSCEAMVSTHETKGRRKEKYPLRDRDRVDGVFA